METVLILRSLGTGDAPAVARLTEQLGYALDPGAAEARIASVFNAAGHYTVGAFAGGSLVGFLHCFDRPSIEKGRALVVQALVVDKKVRGTGAGRRLMAEAERLARVLECTAVSLSSRDSRTGAHAFYERLGYRMSAGDRIFTKQL
ncbi:GNAT family N-acetyltransferase [Nisaea sp.]|uniref:GNAT family N-acetyltransferase n=1 Tax=Nisaea sp. TaxID=2024842 RepID=UPI003B5194A9